jgi:threonyl-tRNA synthetase
MDATACKSNLQAKRANQVSQTGVATPESAAIPLVRLPAPVCRSEPHKIDFITRDDPRALELIRHDAAHVLAEAVQELWPGTQVTIGPVIENGFYYDFARNEPFTPEDLPRSKRRCGDHRAQQTVHQGGLVARQGQAGLPTRARPTRSSWSMPFPADQDLKIYYQGDWFDLCRGPHMASTGQIGNAFKLMKVAGAYWRGDSNNPMLTRIYGTAWASRRARPVPAQLEEAEKRDHRRSAARWTCSISRKRARASCSGTPRAGDVPDARRLYAPPSRSGDYQEVNAPQVLDKSLWETSGHWGWYRENMFKVTVAGDDTDDERVFALKPMNCPGHVQIFKHGLKSYRELPIRLPNSATSIATSRRARCTA